MVEKLALSSRLSALEGYITELRDFASYSREAFVGEPHVHHLAERFLHLASESVLDAAQHVISQMGYRQPNNYKDAMQVLHEEDVLESDLAAILLGDGPPPASCGESGRYRV